MSDEDYRKPSGHTIQIVIDEPTMRDLLAGLIYAGNVAYNGQDTRTEWIEQRADHAYNAADALLRRSKKR